MRARASIIAVGGLIAGTCDIAYAIGFSALRGVGPTRILQSVASGLFGEAAFAGGGAMAAIGLLLHYLIALIFAFFFGWAAERMPALIRKPVVWGAVYGFGIYWVMNLIVLPLSAFPRKVSFAPVVVATGLVVHMLLVGVPIALAARRALRPSPTPLD